MRYIRDTLDFRVEEKSVLTIGKFDGLHRGHALLMRELRRRGGQGFCTVVFTFDLPPQAKLSDTSARVLTTNREKERLFAQLGVDVLIECPFTEQVRNLSPDDFLRWIVEALHVRCVIAGRDLRFGHDRAGDYHTLEQLSGRYGYEPVVFDKIQENGREISSSYIREELMAGQLSQANRLLGYPYFVEGTVVHGRQIGRTIGVPTINLLPPAEKLLPPNGVYMTHTSLSTGEILLGVTNVGCKPTIEGTHPVGVETHLLDFSGELYGQEVKVAFLSFLRPEIPFPSVEALREQMERDIAYVRQF